MGRSMTGSWRCSSRSPGLATVRFGAKVYVRWELGLLGELGFGLDLTACAATGSNDGLAYVSPRTGRAVSLSAGEPYRDRLLVLPPFLASGGGPVAGDIRSGLALTGYFLERHVFEPLSRPLPRARHRLADRVARLEAS